MLDIRFAKTRGKEDHVLGPDRVYLKNDRELEMFRGDPESGLDGDRGGTRTPHRFTWLQVDSTCRVRFEDDGDQATAMLGPFEHVTVVNGTIWYRRDGERLLAKYDDHSSAWYVYPNHKKYATAVLAPAAGR